MTFDHVDYFLSIVEYKSFSRAADELYLSQSSLSKQIKSLENELGKQLFARQGAQIELTSYGKLFWEFAKKVSREYQNFISQLPQDNTVQMYTLRLGVLPLLFEYNLMGIILKFQMVHDNIQLMLFEDNQAMLIKLLDNHQLDLIIARSDYIPPYKYDFITTNYDALCVICFRNHCLAGMEKLSLKQIKDEPIIILEESSSVHHMFHNACFVEGFVPNITFSSNRHGHLLGMLEKNSNMIAILPGKLVSGKIDTDFVVIPLSNDIFTTTSLIRLKETKGNRCLDAFFEYWNMEVENKSLI